MYKTKNFAKVLAKCAVSLLIICCFQEIFGVQLQVTAGSTTSPSFLHNSSVENGYPGLLLRRLKRQNGRYDKDGECIHLPAEQPRSFARSEPQNNFLDLLNRGSRSLSLSKDDKVTKAILILGNKKVGKTTFTQIMAGDPGRLHVVMAQNNEKVIVDDDNRIGSQKPLNKLVPRLVLKKGENNRDNAYYDCPSVDDNRGTEEAIVYNFFMKQILTRLTRVKLLFLVTHSSLQSNQNDGDFDLLAEHAVTVLKNFGKYSNSIGLVVTKVDVDKNDHIMDSIVEFLKNYDRNLRAQINSNSRNSQSDIMKRKLEFVNSLLQLNDKGEYDRITYSRNPERCGSLKDSQTVIETNDRVSRLLSGSLVYSPVDYRDFEYSLNKRSKASLNLKTYTDSLNQAVTKEMSFLMSDFSNYQEKILFPAKDMSFTTSQLQKSSKEITNLLLGTLRQLGNTSDPENFLENMKPTLKSLGYTVPNRVENFMRQQKLYFDFFDELGSTSGIRSVQDWVTPIEKYLFKLADLKEWYEFCFELQDKVRSYDWQVDKPKMPEGEVDWLDFIEWESRLRVNSQIRLLGIKLDRVHVNLLDEIMKFSLVTSEVQCENDVGKITVTGNFVLLTDFISKNIPIIGGCGPDVKIKHVEVYAADTLFIDENLEAEGMELNIVMIAPTWVVVNGAKHFNLNGSPGPNVFPEVAEDGNNSTRWVGESGKHGIPGKPGGPGGSFFGLAGQTRNLDKLMITSIGGEGGKGQDGGNGGNGGDTSDSMRVSTITVSLILYDGYWRTYSGYRGYSGGSGGDGGAPGEGGHPGNVKLFCNKSTCDANLVAKSGLPGKPGSGGKGGKQGPYELGTECKWSEFIWSDDEPMKCENTTSNQAQDGKNGTDGASSVGLLSPKRSTYTIVEWKSILNFKFKTIHSFYNKEWKAFISFIDESRISGAHFSVQAFVEELERISALKDQRDQQVKLELLLSFINRIQTYSKQNLGKLLNDEKKVIAYLLTFAYSQLTAMEQNHWMGMVVNVEQYFKVVRQQMENMKEVSALVAMEQSRNIFHQDLQAKIGDVNNFLDDLVTPAVLDAEVELQTRLSSLEDQFNALILKTQLNLKFSRAELANAKKNLRIKQVLDAAKIVVNFGTLVGGITDWIDKGASIIDTLKEKGSAIVDDFDSFINATQKIKSGGLPALKSAFTSGEKLYKNAKDLYDTIVGNGTVTLAKGKDNNVTNEENNSTAISLTKLVSIFGQDIGSNMFDKYSRDHEKIAALENLVREFERDLVDAQNRKQLIQQSFVPTVGSILTSLEVMVTGLQSKSDTSTVAFHQLHVNKWQVAGVLRDVKMQFEMLSRGIETREFVNAVDRVQDSITMTIDLYEDITKYQETQALTNYMAVISSARWKNIQVGDPSLSGALVKMEKAVATNLFRKEYYRALHAFKQWVFPFAKIHLSKDLQLYGVEENLDEVAMKQVSQLEMQLEQYKASTLSVQDTHIIHTNFSSSHRSSSPFYVWKSEQWHKDISNLLAGEPVYLTADVRSEKGRDAVKFKLIEINFKIPEDRQSRWENQETLNYELENFGVMMTHSGVSYYKFQGNFYVMTGSNQTIRYNFERDAGSGNRLGTNRVYEKFKKGDYLLSPYTTWTIQLVKGLPGSSLIDFQRLERFAPYVDLELVGTGIYVDGENLKVDLEVEKYYQRDDSILAFLSPE